ncbi:hypothetical protein ABTY98_14040 [Streptomyces sp. NPDC096040]|uniref:hypothetical protein n=1 Tax=Streptomyces sp. NPDC096040 TaxID=3155541 RepID=UPI003320AD9F
MPFGHRIGNGCTAQERSLPGNGQLTPAGFAPYAAAMKAENIPVNFVALKKGTVVWRGLAENSVDDHVCTWRAASTIEGIRDWLFERRK